MIDIFLRQSDEQNCYWLLGGKGRFSLCKMPLRFHQDLITIEFNGGTHNIPESYDEFLRYRYGEWRVPIKEWDAFVNDGSVFLSSAAVSEIT